jgi:hypothetical protein
LRIGDELGIGGLLGFKHGHDHTHSLPDPCARVAEQISVAFALAWQGSPVDEGCAGNNESTPFKTAPSASGAKRPSTIRFTIDVFALGIRQAKYRISSCQS